MVLLHFELNSLSVIGNLLLILLLQGILHNHDITKNTYICIRIQVQANVTLETIDFNLFHPWDLITLNKT